MNILYSSDDNYVRISMISIASLLENNMEEKKINIYYIDDGISYSNKEELVNLVKKFKRNLIFIESEKLNTEFIEKTNYPKAGYLRLLISNIISEDKIIYIDCDTLILGPLKEIWNIELSNYAVAGTLDTVQNYVATSIGMETNERYINAGVLLLNLDYWRKNKIEDKIIKFFNQYNGRVPHHDQGVINGVLKNKILIMKPQYNLMSQFFIYKANELKKMYNLKNFYSQKQINDAIDKPIIVHFLNKFYGRPWELQCKHPLVLKYDEYAYKYSINLDKKYVKKNKKVLIGETLYKLFPFSVYLFYEKMMDKKRFYYFRKEYLVSKND